MLQCVAVCCSVLQCVAVCCSVLQCVTGTALQLCKECKECYVMHAVCCSVDMQGVTAAYRVSFVLQCVAVRCRAMHAACCSVLHAVCDSDPKSLFCVAVCCSVYCSMCSSVQQ